MGNCDASQPGNAGTTATSPAIQSVCSVYSVVNLYPFALGKDEYEQQTLVISVAPSGLWECMCRCRGSRFAHPRLYRSRPFRAFHHHLEDRFRRAMRHAIYDMDGTPPPNQCPIHSVCSVYSMVLKLSRGITSNFANGASRLCER